MSGSGLYRFLKMKTFLSFSLLTVSSRLPGGHSNQTEAGPRDQRASVHRQDPRHLQALHQDRGRQTG